MELSLADERFVATLAGHLSAAADFELRLCNETRVVECTRFGDAIEGGRPDRREVLFCIRLSANDGLYYVVDPVLLPELGLA